MKYEFINYEKKYLKSCAELVKDTWDFHSDFKGIKNNLIIYIAYVCDCLNYSKHCQLIIGEDDKVYGLLFGSIENETFVYSLKYFFKNLLNFFIVINNILLGKLGNRVIAIKNFRCYKTIDEEGEKFSNFFDGEVNLFIVNKELRGKKYGYKLMNNYINFCYKNGLKSIFLWTELSCTYTFYERYGFKKFATFYNKDLTENHVEKNNGFIYCYDINNKMNNSKIKIVDIDKTNVEDVKKIEIKESQQGMVEPIYQCLLDVENCAYGVQWENSAISIENTIIGYAMYGIIHYEKNIYEDEVWLDRFMIDKNYQSKGYGKEAFNLVCKMLLSKYNKDIYLSVFADNKVAIKMYKDYGFKFNGEKDDNCEDVMVLEI